MRRLRSLSLVLLVGSASALEFPKVSIERGYAGPIVADVTLDGVAFLVSGATSTLTVYSKPPTGAVAGTKLFECSLTAAGSPTNRLVCTLTAQDTNLPGSYYAVISITKSSITDVAHGVVEIAGR